MSRGRLRMRMGKGKMKYRMVALWALLLLAWAVLPALAEGDATEMVVLTTTDMHGKCWETNLLTGEPVDHNMLRVSTAVSEIRETWGAENVILIDNGDLFQGTPLSEEPLLKDSGPDAIQPMALCLSHIGYDAFVLGNHEFNYPWETMCRVYESLKASGVPVLAANVCYDGTDGVHAAGESAFGAYIVREVTVNGHVHRVGILGLENTDVPRWDLPANFPGLLFTHPDNPDCSLAWEVARRIPEMRRDGCEMIIVACHCGLGDVDLPLTFGINSEDQGMRILRENRDIDLLVLGHDHSTAYANALVTDGAGKEVPVVNGGGQSMTKTVFRLTEDDAGHLVCALVDSRNLDLGEWEPDAALQEMIRPCAEPTDEALALPVGTLTGEWDGSREFQLRQSDTMDLICAAMMHAGTERMRGKFGDSGLEALKQAAGLDHLDVDAAFTTAVNGGYIPAAGPVSLRDIYRMYRFASDLLVLPMYGSDIRAVLEENAAERLTCRVLGGVPVFLPMNDKNTHLITGGINFTYDMAKAAGERVRIEGFANGRPFDPDGIYLVAVNNFILGNERCGLRNWSEEDALFSQDADEQKGTIQDYIAEYIASQSVSPEAFTWRWSITFSEDPAALPPPDGPEAALRVDEPEEGGVYVLYNEAQGCTLADRESGSGYGTVSIEAWGDALVGPIPEDALIFTAHRVDTDTLMLTDRCGRYFTSGTGGGLSLTDAPADGDLSLWQLLPVENGWYLKSVGAENDQALEVYNDRVSTYRLGSASPNLFNFYAVTAP